VLLDELVVFLDNLAISVIVILGTDSRGEVEHIELLIGKILLHPAGNVVENILVQGLIAGSLKGAHHPLPIRVVQLQVVVQRVADEDFTSSRTEIAPEDIFELSLFGGNAVSVFVGAVEGTIVLTKNLLVYHQHLLTL
jgi:hypothetical protein